MRRPGEREVVRIGGRKNKNEILGLTNARLVKERHLNGVKYSSKEKHSFPFFYSYSNYFIIPDDIELVQGIQTNVNNGDFVLILRTDGRIVAMSDEVEHHLGKTMVKYFSFIFRNNKTLHLAFIIYSMHEHV